MTFHALTVRSLIEKLKWFDADAPVMADGVELGVKIAWQADGSVRITQPE